jgi:GMP synthase-like glutamine amidotransferase
MSSALKLHSLQHVPFEDLGRIKPWALEQGISLSSTRLYENEIPPDLDAFDWLVILGGPMNIYEESRYPWLRAEKDIIRRAISAQKRVLGICLGAQLIADVLGAKVVGNEHKEIGWFPVSVTEAGQRHPLLRGIPNNFMAVHWHGDTFQIPSSECCHLARSAACENQAFALGPRVLGLQFHLEYSRESLETMLRHCGDELVPGPFIQTLKEMEKDDDEYLRLDKLLRVMLGNMLAGWNDV